jgi:hypothetical protein
VSEPALIERLEAWRAGPPAECPPAEAYAAVAVGDLVGSWAALLEEHALACALCAAERDLAREFLGEASSAAAGAATDDVAAIVRDLERTVAAPLMGSVVTGRVVAFRRRSTWRSWSVPLAAAATLALGIGVFWQSRSLPDLPDPGNGGPIRSSTVELLSPRGDLGLAPGELPASAGLEFRWAAVAGAAKYRVRLLDATGGQLWQDETLEPRIELPAGARELLADRVRYRWTVTALGAADAPVATSDPVEFRWLPRKESP